MSKDITSDRSFLPRHYEIVPFVFTYDNGADHAWEPAQTEVRMTDTGIGNPSGDDALFTFASGQNKDASLTSLFKDGYLSKESHFAVCGLGIEILGPARTVSLDGATTKVHLGNSSLAIQQNTRALTEDLYRAVIDHARLAYVLEDESCETYLGGLSEYPAGEGLDNASPNNGVAVKGNERFFGRAIVLSPQSSNGTGQNFRVTINHPGKVPFDPSFAEPGLGDDVALFVRVTYVGWLSDAQGNPLGQAADPNGYAIYQRFAAGGGRCF